MEHDYRCPILFSPRLRTVERVILTGVPDRAPDCAKASPPRLRENPSECHLIPTFQTAIAHGNAPGTPPPVMEEPKLVKIDPSWYVIQPGTLWEGNFAEGEI